MAFSFHRLSALHDGQFVPTANVLNFDLKVRARWLFGHVLVLIGLFLVLYFAGLLLWQCITWLTVGVWVPLPAKLSLVDHSLLQGPQLTAVLKYIPEFHSTWVNDPKSWLVVHNGVIRFLNLIHIGVVPAVVGVLTMTGGRFITIRQNAALDLKKRLTADRLRRVEEYRKQ